MNSPRSDYELIDSGDQRKLERFGDLRLVRPSAQAVWRRREIWRDFDVEFERDSSGTGTWRGARGLPDSWPIEHAGLTWILRPNRFGHLGIFPEQAICWRWIQEQVRAFEGDTEVLNLFGYTGGSTLSAAAAGARVVHVDASKTSVRHARENAARSGLEDHPIRWITEDAVRFVEREIRRERRYQGVVLDPPSYGRGTRGETWQIDDQMVSLLDMCRTLLADGGFLLLTSHSPGYTPLVLKNLIEGTGASSSCECGEMTIVDAKGRPLPGGAFARGRVTS